MSEGTGRVEEASCPVRSGPAGLWPGRSVRRWAFALLGLLSVGLGFLGVLLPGLPTTIFLIFASYCFTRSCPWLEERLVRAPVFRPYLRYLDGEQAMPLRARLVTIALIWVSVSASFGVVSSRGALRPWFVWLVGGAAVVGTVVVSRIYRGPREDAGGGDG
ncbi:MAG: DUF454 family protein [Gemmatimonadota bacterium]|nr:DUF454 family protein [Gemmatimonadota bacterium]